MMRGMAAGKKIKKEDLGGKIKRKNGANCMDTGLKGLKIASFE